MEIIKQINIPKQIVIPQHNFNNKHFKIWNRDISGQIWDSLFDIMYMLRKVKVKFKTFQEGGRLNMPGEGYRPTVVFNDYGEHRGAGFFKFLGDLELGKEIEAEIKLFDLSNAEELLVSSNKFDIMEGNRVVGNGYII